MMKRALINLLFVLSTVLIANGQSGSRAAELFTAADGSFSVAFPKPPMIVGENHRVEISPNEVYSVLYLDRPTPTVDEFERRLRLAYTKKPGAKAIVHQGYSGSEYKDVDMSRETEDTGRVFFVKQRLFRIQVRTPILRTLPEALRRAYEKKLAAFFSSFKIRTIPPVRPPVVPVMPVDIGTL